MRIWVREYRINRVDHNIDFSEVLDYSKGAIEFLYRKDGSVVRGINKD
jgi:hypothetical protein